MNLRERVEADLAISLEGLWGLPVTLTSPDAEKQIFGPDGVTPLRGQVLYGIARLNPETGEEITVETPVVTLRRSSLTRVPAPGENWIIEIPATPSETGTMTQYAMSATRPPEGGRSIGFIRIYLQELEDNA